MVKTKWLIAALIVALFAAGAVFLFPGEERKVRKHFSQLAHYVSKGEGEKILTMAGKMKSLESLFAERCRLTLPPYSLDGDFSGAEIANLTARARMPFAHLTLAFHDLSVSFPDPETAQARLTGEINGKPARGDTFREAREIACLLRKKEGRWLFSRIEVVEVLKR